MLRKLILFCLLMSTGFSMSQVGIGKWRAHTSGYQGFIIEKTNTSIYMSHGSSIMVYDIETGEVENWNSVNFLTDINVTAIQYNPSDGFLYIGYDNGNIDMIKNNTLYNLPAIRLSSIIGLKSIQRFVFDGAYTYVCTGFGVVVVNPIKFEVKDTYYPTATNNFVYDLAFFNGRIYVATENGMYSGQVGDPFLPAPGAWTPMNGHSGTQLTAKYTEIETVGNRMFFTRKSSAFSSDSLFYLENNTIVYNPIFPLSSLNNLRNQNDTLLISNLGGMVAWDTSLTKIEEIFQYPFDSYPQVMGTVHVGEEYWMADAAYGMVRARNSWAATSYNTGGPYRPGAYQMDWADGKLGTTSGYIDGIGSSSFNQNGVNLFENEEWTRFHRDLTPQLDSDTIYDFTSIAINPDNTNQVFFGTSSNGGMYEILDGKTIATNYDENNSAIQKRSNFNDFYSITNMSFDFEGHLWVANSFCAEQLVCKTSDNQWLSFDLGSTGKNVLINELFVDYSNNKWIGTKGKGIIVYDDNTTPTILTDDRIKVLTPAEGNGALPNGEILCTTMDFDEEIWIGTTAGLAVIYSPQNIWDGLPGEYDAQRILVERDGFVEVLFGETPITDIEVDGANRKWVATEGSGVFLISEDGTEEIHHFTTSNSPMVSNNVFDIELDHLTGEVFIGTELGLVSYRADATYGDFEFGDVFSYPNPVRPEFTGNITIIGVAFDSDVRITDVAGNLVYRTTSNGGTVLWNGKTTTGERVKSGVYIVWAGEKNDKGRAVTKILFIN